MTDSEIQYIGNWSSEKIASNFSALNVSGKRDLCELFYACGLLLIRFESVAVAVVVNLCSLHSNN